MLILRDWPNLVASRLGLIAKDGSKGRPTLDFRLPWDGVADLWTEYAEIIASGADNPQHINYNRWVSDPTYHRDLAARYGVTSMEEYKQAVPFNGGGSSFQGREFDGRATDMNTLSRWNDLPFNLVPQFKEVVNAYPTANELSGRIFGIQAEQAVADLALRHP